MVGSKKFELINSLKRLPVLPRDMFVSTILSGIKPIYPTSMVYYVSFRCNARCVMCNNWQRPYDKDLSIEEIRSGLESSLFSKITNLGLSGGEPFLREDLKEIVEACRENMPRLKKATINTNGFATKRVMEGTEDIVRFCNENGLLMGIRISVDGFGETHDKIRGVPGGFDKCMKTMEAMIKLQKKHFFSFGLAYTINPANVKMAREMYEWCEDRGINVIFNIPRFTDAALDNSSLQSTNMLSEDDQVWVGSFFEELVRKGSILNGDIYLYHNYVKQFRNGGRRTMACPFQHQGLQLNPFGELHYCEMSEEIGNMRDGDAADAYFSKQNLDYRREIRESVCPTCLCPCMVSVDAANQVFPYTSFVMEKTLSKFFQRNHNGNGNGKTPNSGG